MSPEHTKWRLGGHALVITENEELGDLDGTLEQAFSTGGARATRGACGQSEWRAAVPKN